MARRTVTTVAVGVNASEGTPVVLSFAERDAVQVASAFTSAIACPDSQAFHLTGRDATTDSVLGLLQMLQEQPPEHLIFYFSGHAGDPGIGLSNGLLRHDVLRQALEYVPSKTLLSIFDSCHAAAHRRRVAIGGVGRPTRLDWMQALASATPGARAMFGSAAERNAREDHQRKQGRFTAALLTALQSAPGDPQWQGLFANERAVFDKAVMLLARRYGDDQGAEGMNLWGDLPLVQSQQHVVIGEADVSCIVPRAHELTVDALIDTLGREGLPTQVICTVTSERGVIVHQSRAAFRPALTESSEIFTFSLPPIVLRRDPLLVHSLTAGWTEALSWCVEVLDQRGRVLAYNDAAQFLSLHSGALRAA